MFNLHQLLTRKLTGDRITFRILIPLILATGVLLATFAISIWRIQQKEMAADAALTAQEVDRWLHAEVNQKTAVLKTTSQAVMNDGQLLAAFRRRDRAAVLERAQPLFDSLRSEHGVSHFYFHLPDRTVWLRVHDPAVSGDKIERATMLAAERTGQVSSGIERGLTGVFTLRVVSPWRQDGQLLGYLELGVEFESLVQNLHKQISENVDLVVAVDKKFIDRQQWADAMKRAGRTDDWDRFPQLVVINQTVATLPKLADDYLLSKNPRLQGSGLAGNLQLVVLPLTEVAGENLGRMIVLKNVAERMAETRSFIRFVVGFNLAVGAVVIGFFYLFLTGVEKDLSDRTKELQWKTAFLEAQVNSTIDGILVVDQKGKKILQNQRNADLFKIPPHIAADKDDGPQLRWVTDMAKNPGVFFDKVVYLNSHPDEISRDEVELKDGTMLDRYSSPVVGQDGRYYGRIWTFRDITEQRRVEQELKEAKVAAAEREGAQRYNFLADTVPLMIWTTRPDGGVDYFNQAWLDYTGLTPAQTKDWGWDAVLHPDDLQRCIERWTRSITTGESYEIEYRFKRAADGTYRWFLGRGSARRNEAGEIVQWVGTCTDIDDQKRAASELESRVAERTAELANANEALQSENAERKRAEESLRLLNSAVEQAKESILITDADLNLPGPRIIFVNPAFTQMTGYTAGEVLGKTPRILQGPRSERAVMDRLRETLGRGDTFQGEAINYRKDGTEFDMEWQIAPLRNASGTITHFVAIQRDITLRRQAETALRESDERYRSLIDNARDAIFTIAADGTFTSLNPAVETIAGLARADWIGKPFAPMVHPDDLPLAREMFQHILQGGQTPVHELRGHPSLKQPALMEMTLTAQKDGSGKIIGVLGIGRDITERKRLEAQLVQSQKLETVGKLAGGVAHEFNSILTAIIGQSELLLGDLPAGSPLATNALEIRQAADRAASLTRQLLAYGRKQLLQPEILDLNSVLAGMESTLRHLLGRGTDVIFAPAAGLKAVKADAGQIEQVIMNLAINAREAMPNGGKLTLETAAVSFDQETVGRYPELKPGDYAMLAISDTGTGMNAEVKARIFEPFYTTKDVGQGSGLGLSTCYGIIKQSGGHISVYSEPGRGTIFKIYLPQVAAPTKPPLQRLETTNLPRGTETILLVEDDPALREMAATLLRRLGYTVLTAANGVEALSLKQQRDVGHIDLLFTDVVMPHMSGKELAERVRALYPHTRILFTSAYTEQAIVHQGMVDQGVALLQKPFTPSALANKVRQMLDQPGAAKTGGCAESI